MDWSAQGDTWSVGQAWPALGAASAGLGSERPGPVGAVVGGLVAPVARNDGTYAIA